LQPDDPAPEKNALAIGNCELNDVLEVADAGQRGFDLAADFCAAQGSNALIMTAAESALKRLPVVTFW
jgi:hypothetical protein